MDQLDLKRNQDLEVSIVGCLLNDSSYIENEWVAKLSPSDFMYEYERTVFITIKELEKSQQVIDLTTVINRLKEKGKLEKVGGAYYISGLLTENRGITVNLPSYAQTLIGNTKHNKKIRLLEDVRLGKADISTIDELAQAERINKYDMSDGGNAKLFAELHSDKMQFNHTNKIWYVWNGQYWQKDVKKEIYSYALDVSQVRQRNAITIEHPGEKSAMFNFGVRSGNKSNMDSMLSVASTLPEFATTSDDWDQDVLLFQCNNGILVLTDESFIQGKPEHMISQSSGINYDSNADCPSFDQFLIDIMNGDEELAEYLLMCLGYSMSGLTEEQCMFILNGNGANGKSVLLDLMSHVLGDYLVHTRFDAFLKKYNSANTNDLARLSKARIVTANESGEGKNWDQERIKEMTGGDKITARFLYGEFFEFRSKVKLWCATNNLPKTDDLSDAFWRRMVVIPFDRQFKGENRNTNILAELKQESSGIINRLYQGFLQWTYTTLKKQPPRVVIAVNEYKAESDVVAQWIDETGVEKNGSYDSTPAKVVYHYYMDWHEKNASGKPVPQITFGKRMKSIGMESEKIGGNRVYVGIDFNNQD